MGVYLYISLHLSKISPELVICYLIILITL